ncbi:cysteine desulfurase [Weeksellaceae bacterium KMM 9724]|uniref:cysteine desulfurase family protein n=1 Tax=Profundicola chukchiensis TaxID=2961959 RepID=UPI0024382EBE|nr:cysteine desulfurase family protein [Profundicola chukchiensis]MDG4951351.1 cysteine desulfurase [Profundicola chukchiensis]
MQKVYLDNAATTHMHEEVIQEMVNAMRFNFGNPSSSHFFGRESKGYIEKARKTIAQYTGVTSAEIIFTSGGTEANNLILRSSVEYLGVERIITTRIEHSCVAETVNSLNKNQNIQVDYVNLNDKGEIDLEDLQQLLKASDKKTIVSIMHANNEIGNLNPIEKIGDLAHAHDAYYHSDMVQTLGHYAINLENLPVDFASSSAHKFHGPKGTGFAYIKKSTGLKAQITGGGQERNMRSGTENVHGILGLGKAFEMANENLEKDMDYIFALKEYAIQELQSAFPDIHFNGMCATENSLYTLLSLSLPFKDGLIGFELDLRGIACSQGSACQSGAAKSSRVLNEILSEDMIASTTPLRISFSTHNKKEDIDYLLSVLKEISARHSATA